MIRIELDRSVSEKKQLFLDLLKKDLMVLDHWARDSKRYLIKYSQLDNTSQDAQSPYHLPRSHDLYGNAIQLVRPFP